MTATEVNESTVGPVAVVGNDVDLLVLLTGLTSNTDNLYFYKISTGNNQNELYSTISHHHLKQYILFAHDFAGCDTTSAIYGKGKKKILAILSKNDELQKLVQIFYHRSSSIEDIYLTAEKIILYLYNSFDTNISLGDLRYIRFQKSAFTASTEVKLAIVTMLNKLN